MIPYDPEEPDEYDGNHVVIGLSKDVPVKGKTNRIEAALYVLDACRDHEKDYMKSRIVPTIKDGTPLDNCFTYRKVNISTNLVGPDSAESLERALKAVGLESAAEDDDSDDVNARQKIPRVLISQVARDLGKLQSSQKFVDNIYKLENNGKPYRIDFGRIRKELIVFRVDKKNGRWTPSSFFILPLIGTESKVRAEREVSAQDPEEAMRIAQQEVLQQDLNELLLRSNKKKKKKTKKPKNTLG